MGIGRYPAGLCAVVLLTAACAAPAPNVSRLDPGGLTVVTRTDAILLARPVPALAVGARDFVYVGPVEVNRMGQRRYFFWIALASTVDRDLLGIDALQATQLALLVDGEPMVFPLSEWSADLDQSPYDTDMAVYATMQAPASLDQIRRIADAGSLDVHIIDDSGGAYRYRKWRRDWSSWSTFPHLQ